MFATQSTFPRDATITAAALCAALGLEAAPNLVAERPGGPRRKRVQVWNAAGRALCVRWDRNLVFAWLTGEPTDGPPWSAERFAAENRVPMVGA